MTGAAGSIRADARAWLRRHGYSLASSIGSLVRNPVTSVLTIAVLAFALSLPLGLYSALENLRQINRNLERLDTISVFLETSAGEENSRRIASRLSSRADVLAVDPVSPEAGMNELAGATGLEASDLGDVPLPWVLEVAPASGADPAALADELRRLEGVDLVVVDLAWVERLEAILAVFARLVELLAVLFALAVLFVISNNIRSEIQGRAEEIEVMALVGATPGYIRRPFLYSGLWMGMIGALAAWLLVHAGIALLQAPVRELAAAYGTPTSLSGPPPWLLAALVAGSGALGVAGAWIAVSRQLSRINP